MLGQAPPSHMSIAQTDGGGDPQGKESVAAVSDFLFHTAGLDANLGMIFPVPSDKMAKRMIFSLYHGDPEAALRVKYINAGNKVSSW